MRLLLLLAALLSQGALAHSMEPGTMRVLVRNGYTEFPVHVVNRYDTPTMFSVQVFEDGEPITFEAEHGPLLLGEHKKGRVFVRLNNLTGKEVKVCSLSAGGISGQLSLQSRVCTRVTLYHRSEL